ncbi:MAG: HNH endonuclease [Taibaiella sp.]|nr:HNH endonuclease [Taibaiella sp.]
MSKCYNCDTTLTESNRSVEHIILNAVGGRLKSSDLLCVGCNSKMGNSADAELAKQFQFLSGHLQVKRDNGAIPTTKGGKLADGTEINLLSGITPSLAKPKFSVEQEGDKLVYNVVARSDKEMKTILEGIAKKHTQFDVNHAMSKARKGVERLKEPVSFSQVFGGKLAFRSIAKTAVNFYLYNKGDKENIRHLLPYLFEKDDLDVVKHFHSKKSLYKKEAGEIIHLLHIVGNKHDKVLYCYVEFFSTHSYLIMLSEKYNGKNIRYTYAYNIISKSVVEKKVNLKISRDTFNKLSSGMQDYFLLVKEKTDRIMKIANKIHTNREIDNITSRAIKDIFEIKYGHEELITQQMIDEFTERIANDMVEFMYGNDVKDI